MSSVTGGMSPVVVSFYGFLAAGFSAN